MPQLLTLCIIQQEDRVLLGLKKRGFGAGRWNGFGGKIKDGESLEEAAIRELHEEIGIWGRNLEKRGVLLFRFENNPELLEVHVFCVGHFDGEPVESEEMKPQWFSKDEIPYEKMWQDDKHWLPLFLSGKRFRGEFWFKDDVTMTRSHLEEATEV